MSLKLEVHRTQKYPLTIFLTNQENETEPRALEGRYKRRVIIFLGKTMEEIAPKVKCILFYWPMRCGIAAYRLQQVANMFTSTPAGQGQANLSLPEFELQQLEPQFTDWIIGVSQQRQHYRQYVQTFVYYLRRDKNNICRGNRLNFNERFHALRLFHHATLVMTFCFNPYRNLAISFMSRNNKLSHNFVLEIKTFGILSCDRCKYKKATRA